MSKAGRGYSTVLLRLVEAQDPKDPVTQYAKHCITTDFSVVEVSELFGVSRAMVYYWFKGAHRPRPQHIAKMVEILGNK